MAPKKPQPRKRAAFIQTSKMGKRVSNTVDTQKKETCRFEIDTQ